MGGLQHATRTRRCLPLSFTAIALLAAAITITQNSAAAAPLQFGLPIACDMARDCAIEAYVDVAPGGNVADYRCETLSYDGHQGTDFRLRDFSAMQRGVPVLAAAAGIVRNVRDGIADLGAEEWRRTGSDGTSLGNAVVIRHADGTETLYGHLRQGSTTVQRGDRVVAGQVIGLVGFSGKTEFPHLHFQIMHAGRPVDPFSGGIAGESGCSHPVQPRWSPTALDRLDYRPASLVCAGFAFDIPTRKAIMETCPVPRSGSTDSVAILMFAELAGVQAGDQLRMLVRRPDGSVLLEQHIQINRAQARQFRYAGRKRPDNGWPTGWYTALLELERGTTRLISTAMALEIR